MTTSGAFNFLSRYGHTSVMVDSVQGITYTAAGQYSSQYSSTIYSDTFTLAITSKL
jgi:hypothetical protein